mgnify:CR=1 FL=1
MIEISTSGGLQGPQEEMGLESGLGPLGMVPETILRVNSDPMPHDRSKQVCICGHAINKHKDLGRRVYCETGRMVCPCLQEIPVLVVGDTRYFMRKTLGWGSKHALARNLVRCIEKRVEIRWLTDQDKCWNATCTNTPVYPVPLDENVVVDRPAPVNVLLCESCALKMRGLEGYEGRGFIW